MRLTILGFVLGAAVSACHLASPTHAQDAGADAPAKERRLRGHSGPVHRLRFTPDGKRLLSVSGWPGHDYSLRAWDLTTDQELYRVAAPGSIGTFTISADGHFALVGARGAILYVDVETGATLQQLRGHKDSIQGVVFAADGKHVFSASHDGTARQWDLKSGNEIRRFQVRGKWAKGVAELPGGRILTVDVDGVLQVWDVATGAEVKSIETGSGWLSSMTLLPDQTVLLGARTVALWDLQTEQKVRSFPGHDNDVQEMSLSPEGKLLVTASYDGTVRLWDFARGEQLCVLSTQTEWFFAATFSPDGRHVAAGGGGGREGNNYVSGKEHDIRLLDITAILNEASAASDHVWAGPALCLGGVTLVAIATVVVVARRRRTRPAETGALETADVQFKCPGCGKKLKTRSTVVGKKLKCPHCGALCPVPPGSPW